MAFWTQSIAQDIGNPDRIIGYIQDHGASMTKEGYHYYSAIFYNNKCYVLN
jgi:hypothetical protein